MTAPRMRAGDTDRQNAVDRLTRHFTDGRLDPNEYDDRVQKAYAAAYLDEFPALFDDLPGEQERSGRGWGGSQRFGQVDAGWPGPGGGRPGSGRRFGSGPGGQWGMRPPMRRPPAILAVLAAVVGVMFISALVTGLFFVGFPLFWIGLAVFMFTRGGCQRRWGNGHSGERNWGERTGGGRTGPGRY